MNAKQFAGWLHRYWFWIIVWMTIISTVVWSLHYHTQGLNGVQASLKGVFSALQFLVLNKELDDSLLPWQWWTLSATQLLTPLFASLALLSAIFREHLEPIWLQLEMTSLEQDSFWLVVGSQTMSASLIPSLLSTQCKVIALDAPDITLSQRTGTWHLQRDLQSPQVFKDLPIHRARGVVLALDDEELNLKLLQQLQVQMEQLTTKAALLVHCRVQTHALLQLFMDQPGLSICNHQLLDVRPLHVPMLCARALTQLAASFTSPQRGIAIVGTSELARSLIVRFARIGIHSPDQPLQMQWIGKDCSQALQQLASSYPALRSALRPTAEKPTRLELPHLQLVICDGDVNTWKEQLKVSSTLWPDMIYVAHESSSHNMLDARTLQIYGGLLDDSDKPCTRIIALTRTDMLEPASLPHPELPWRCHIELQQPDDLLCKSLVHDRADTMAQSFDSKWSQASGIDNQTWRNLPFPVKESNRDIADHLPWKLAYAGLRPKAIEELLDASSTASDEALTQLKSLLSNEAILKDLIRMEQMRYRSFMTLQGFQPGTMDAHLATQSRKHVERALRINATLGIPFDSLSSTETDKDRNIIMCTPEIVLIAKQFAAHKPSVATI